VMGISDTDKPSRETLRKSRGNIMRLKLWIKYGATRLMSRF
jgi:hypothetical protein